MTGEELLAASKDLESYLESYRPFMGRVENGEHLQRFARGQLGPLERKSLEPIADAEGVPPRALQFFFSSYRWSEAGVRDELQRKVATKYGGPDGIFVIDETSDAKKGEHTAGVARQYCGESGKIDNCIVSVHVAYARGDFHTLIDGELFLPESWNPNPKDEELMERRRRVGLPEDVVHVSKPEMALGQLKRALANGVPGRYVTADEGYGGKPWWRDAVGALGLTYVVEVPCSTQGWIREPRMEIPPWKGRGRVPTKAVAHEAAQTVKELATSARGLRFQRWERFKVHDTQKGPEVWEFKAAPFWEHRGGRCADVQWLLIGRNVRTREVKYFLSNAHAGTPIEVLICVAFSRWRVERCFQDCKTELGLNHAELRTYTGIHRHLILTAANYYFMQDWIRAQGPEKKTFGPDRESVC